LAEAWALVQSTGEQFYADAIRQMAQRLAV
jgi:hypothetical protein